MAIRSHIIPKTDTYRDTYRDTYKVLKIILNGILKR